MTKWWKILYQLEASEKKLEASEKEIAIFILVRVKLWQINTYKISKMFLWECPGVSRYRP